MPDAARKRALRASDKRLAAAEWLTERLYDFGPQRSDILYAAAKRRGISKSTLDRSAKDMGIVRASGDWDLPEDVRRLMTPRLGRRSGRRS